MESISEIQEQIKEIQLAGDSEAEHFLYGELGNRFFLQKDYAHAIEAYQSALKIAEQKHDAVGKGTTFCNLGNVYLDLGDIEEAKRLYEEGLQISRELGDQSLEGDILGNLGLAFVKLEDAEAAKKNFEHALEIAQETKNYTLEMSVLNNMNIVNSIEDEAGKKASPYDEAKDYQSFVARKTAFWLRIFVFIMSVAGITILAVWMLHALSLISQGLTTGIGLFACLLSVTGALIGLFQVAFPIHHRTSHKPNNTAKEVVLASETKRK